MTTTWRFFHKMNKTITTILLFLTFVCYSQDNVVPLENTSQHNPFETPKLYYKDVNNVLDKFIGTWRYQDNAVNPTKVFEITFSKRKRRDVGNVNYTDELISQFSYIVNGVTVYDTYVGDKYYYITGSTLLSDTNNTKMQLFYTEPIIDGRTLRENPRSDLFIDFQTVSGSPTLNWYNKAELDQNNNSPFRIPLLMTLNKI